MSTLHNLSDSDPIWDAVYDQDEFIHYDRSETGPMMRVVAAELRRLADELDVVRGEMRATDDRTIRSSGLGEGIRRLRLRADELDPPASSRTNGADA